MDWHTLDSIRAQWAQAPADDTVLRGLIDQAKADILGFDLGYVWGISAALNTADGVPVPYPGDYPAGAVPSALVTAQRMQIQRLWNVNRVNPTSDGSIRPYPLDWVIKQVARPKRVS